MENEYSEETQYIDMCLRVSGHNVPIDLIELVLAYQNAVEEHGGDMTIKDILTLKKQYIKDKS